MVKSSLTHAGGHFLTFGLCMLGAISLLAGCATSRVAPGSSLADTRLEGGSTAFEHAVILFGKALQASALMPEDSAKAQKAFRSGLSMIDLQCNSYLDAVGSSNQAASNERRQVSLAGGFASAIMGLTGSSAKEIAGVATAFSFTGSSMESFTTAYLFSDAASSVTKIVRESQKAWLDSVATPGNLTNMDSADAVRLLGHYEQICRPAQIRALIDLSIAKGTVVAERAQTADADVGSVLQSLHASLGVPVSEAEAIVLYAWFRNPGQRTSGANLSANEPVASMLANRTAQILERQLAQAFLPISLAGSPVPDRWSPGVRSLLPVTPVAGDGGGTVPPPPAMPLPPKPVAGMRPNAPFLTIR